MKRNELKRGNMRILAIDPGPEQSGWVIYDPEDHSVQGFEIVPNYQINSAMRQSDPGYTYLAIEMIACYGMPVGKEIFETCVWIGQFLERWGAFSPNFDPDDPSDKARVYVYRRDVKMFLCNSMYAKDKNVSQAIRDKFGGDTKAVGGVKCPACKGKGWKGRGRPVCTECNGDKWLYPPGPLYGVGSHIWAALGVALTFASRISTLQEKP